MDECIFCHPDSSRMLLENDLARAIWDAYPATDLHVLVIPRRHAVDYLELTQDEVLACDALVREVCRMLSERDPAIEGYNIGANVGKAAGQTVFHCHLHVIPRRRGDAFRRREA